MVRKKERGRKRLAEDKICAAAGKKGLPAKRAWEMIATKNGFNE